VELLSGSCRIFRFLKAALSGINSSKISLSVGSLASETRLAQQMPQPIALGLGKLGLARGYQQKKLIKVPGLSDSASLSHR